ncbi:MAG: serine/threonine-protein kinase, partial [Actinomycetota bacterium]
MNGTSDRSGHPDPTDDPATDAADAAAAESARLAGYRLTGPPIRGGSGIVHPAIEAATGRAVALKALAPGHDLERLHREAEVLARIDHPNVAALRAFQTIDGAPTLVVDWVDGEPLHQVLHRDGPLGAGRSLAVLSGMAAALDAVHAAGVVHRDVSPANVMIGANGAVTVIDFGVSRSGEAATVTADGMLAGTPRYLAPEVIEGAEPTPRSDQYGAAIVLNELLVGSWPFPEANSMANALHHQLHTAPTPVDEVDPTLGPALTDAILRALDKDPARRFPSMAAFLDAASGVETAPA